MLIIERFLLLFFVWYLIRAIANDGNSFQWKINVAIRTLSHLLSSASCFLLSSCSMLFRLLFLPSALLSFFILFLPSFLPSYICSALPALLFLLCSMGCLPFFDKNRFFIPPSKNSRHFSIYFIPSPIHLTPH